MRHAKRPNENVKPVQMLPWAEHDLLRWYKRHGEGTGWHYGRVTRVDAKMTTVQDRMGHVTTLPHDEFQVAARCV